FIPASHKNLDAVLSGEKYPDLRSVVIDFEDGLSSADRPEALEKLEQTLAKLQETELLRFIRPQDPQMLKTLLTQKYIDRLDGFILPKFGLDNANDYLALFPLPISHSPFPWHFMPSIEGEELFDMQKLRQLRGILLLHQEQIICIRFGAEDMFRQLGLRRTTTSLYDMLAPAQVIANLINTFKPAGFNISAPVHPNFSDLEGFAHEVQRELNNGLISKTIIHPSQIEPMNELYKVTQQELDEAKAILSQHDGVLNLDGKMGEVKTQSVWAKELIVRKRLYGLT
ncbi:MAG: HpcH/HpaI aldolase/citrate lyase family protein, partial [Sulfurimonadaceae bacterium]